MEAVVELYNNLKSLNLQEIEKTVIKKNSAVIIDTNVDQLSHGEGYSGNKLPEYSNPDYAAAKRAEGLTEQAGNNFNILLTGSTREKAFIEDKGNANFVISSRDEKNDRLMKMTDNDIWGIQDKNMTKLEKDYLLNDTIAEIKLKLKI